MLSLSQATAQSTSVAAIGVAAHECGSCRTRCEKLFSIAFASRYCADCQYWFDFVYPIDFNQGFITWSILINLGLIAFALVFIFQLVTLPVEFDASRRAIQILSEGGLLAEDELPMVKKS